MLSIILISFGFSVAYHIAAEIKATRQDHEKIQRIRQLEQDWIESL